MIEEDQTHVFLSYVREDIEVAKYIASLLRANGMRVWIDIADMKPGLPWRDQLEAAIQSGSYFLPIFSKNWHQRKRTVANEELLWAINELRLRPLSQAWFIPVVLCPDAIPDIEFVSGKRLTDIQYVDVKNWGWKAALERLFAVFGIKEPILDSREPLGDG